MVIVRFLLALAALGGSLPLAATTLERLNLTQLIDRSNGIVRGKVTDARTELRGRIIYTKYRFQVTDRAKGDAAGWIEVAAPGGTANGLKQTFPGSPRLALNGEYVVFLWRGPSGMIQVLGLAQGLFEVKPLGGGDAQLSRGSIDAEFVDAQGKPAEEPQISLTWSELKKKAEGAK
jgi:hypothetical protein